MSTTQNPGDEQQPDNLGMGDSPPDESNDHSFAAPRVLPVQAKSHKEQVEREAEKHVDEGDPIDVADLLHRSMSVNVASQALDAFAQQAMGYIVQLADAIAAGDLEQLSEVAQVLKSDAFLVGATGVQRSAKQLIALAQAHQLEESMGALRRLQVQMCNCLEFLPTAQARVAGK